MNLYNSNPTDAPSALHAEKIRLGAIVLWQEAKEIDDWSEDNERKEGGEFVHYSLEALRSQKIASPDEEASREESDPKNKKKDS